MSTSYETARNPYDLMSRISNAVTFHTTKEDESCYKRASQRRNQNFNDLKPICLIGKGAFASVLLVRNALSRKVHALKVMSKEKIQKSRQIRNVQNECNMLSEIDHPFVVGFDGSLQTSKNLCLALEYCPGGNLNIHMKQKGIMSDHLSTLIVAEVASALHHVQERSIVFRDLKPENIFVGQDGHMKLGDFGIARYGIDSWTAGAHSFCGTPQYMAPEVSLSDNYGLACDWWSLGVLLYEMKAGRVPFSGKTDVAIFNKIAQKKPVSLLRSWPDATKSLLRGLLNKYPMKRIGATSGHSEIFSHAFFASIDFVALESLELDAPFSYGTAETEANTDLSTAKVMAIHGKEELQLQEPALSIHWEEYIEQLYTDSSSSSSSKPKVVLEDGVKEGSKLSTGSSTGSNASTNFDGATSGDETGDLMEGKEPEYVPYYVDGFDLLVV